jgi:hypothetical protein
MLRYASWSLDSRWLVLCVIVGPFIPMGSGSAVVIGGVLGMTLCLFRAESEVPLVHLKQGTRNHSTETR